MSNKKMHDPIDFVVLWVDPSDKGWQKSRAEYEKEASDAENVDNSTERYRDWNAFVYWFRGVEKFAPWVNKVHLVTCGHVPKWLNLNHPKLHIVKHSDFMPENALPTFNSNAIELCLHRIPGLAEQFVAFNDDMFITKKIRPTDFFKNGKPVNTMSLLAVLPSSKNSFYKTVLNNVAVIEKHFDYSTFRRQNIGKLLSLKQQKWAFFTYTSLFYNGFIGFRNYHIPISYRKQTFENVWKVEEEDILKTVCSRFRNNDKNLSHWLMNYWQFASGDIIQRRSNFGASVKINNPKASTYVRQSKYRLICLNDTDKIEDEISIKKAILSSFDAILPNKSEFEL